MEKERQREVTLNLILVATILLMISPLILRIFPSLLGADRIVLTIGVSMTPTIMHGDTILLKDGAEDIKVGDIISFRANFIAPVLHRVIEIQKDPILVFRTKGDANPAPDELETTTDKVIGKVIGIMPTSILMTPNVLFITIFLPTLLILKRKDCLISQKSVLGLRTLSTIFLLIILGLSLARLASVMLSPML